MRANGSSGQGLLYVSSLAAAGACGEAPGLSEEAEPRPVSDYGRSKLCAERLVLEAACERPVTVIRPPAVYGPRDPGFLPLFKCARNGVLPVLGRRAMPLSMICVQDLVRGILLASRTDRAAGGIYFMSDGVEYDWRDVVTVIARALGRHGRMLHVPPHVLCCMALINGMVSLLGMRAQGLNPDKWREIRQPGWLCCSAKAVRELGFKAEVKLQEGMTAAASWYRSVSWL